MSNERLPRNSHSFFEEMLLRRGVEFVSAGFSQLMFLVNAPGWSEHQCRTAVQRGRSSLEVLTIWNQSTSTWCFDVAQYFLEWQTTMGLY
jgi:hypothetical protein